MQFQAEDGASVLTYERLRGCLVEMIYFSNSQRVCVLFKIYRPPPPELPGFYRRVPDARRSGRAASRTRVNRNIAERAREREREGCHPFYVLKPVSIDSKERWNGAGRRRVDRPGGSRVGRADDGGGSVAASPRPAAGG